MFIKCFYPLLTALRSPLQYQKNKWNFTAPSFFKRNLSNNYGLQSKEITNENNFQKLKFIASLNFQSPQDAAPFLKLSNKTLFRIYKTTSLDEKNGHCKNRIYFLSEHLKVPPDILGKYVAKRTFIYALSFEWLRSSLDVLLDMGVPPDRILRDLWVLKYNHNTINQRLQKVKAVGVDTLYPWMVRCSEEILNRYIELSQETKNILGDGKSTLTYLAERLNIAPEDVEQMCCKIPSLKTIRATKVKHFIDFLLSEGFDVKDIASKPRILAASPKTVKQRLEHLRGLGIKEINLNVLCRSRKDYNKYIEMIAAGLDESSWTN